MQNVDECTNSCVNSVEDKTVGYSRDNYTNWAWKKAQMTWATTQSQWLKLGYRNVSICKTKVRSRNVKINFIKTTISFRKVIINSGMREYNKLTTLLKLVYFRRQLLRRHTHSFKATYTHTVKATYTLKLKATHTHELVATYTLEFKVKHALVTALTITCAQNKRRIFTYFS